MSEADFIFSKSKELALTGIKNFPIDFIIAKKLNEIEVPDKVLVLGKEFFGSYEVTSATGDFVLTLAEESEAKYIVYASRNRKSTAKTSAPPTHIDSRMLASDRSIKVAGRKICRSKATPSRSIAGCSSSSARSRLAVTAIVFAPYCE